MNHSNDDDDDKGQSLHELSVHHQASIISQLVDIGSERNQQQHDKFLGFISCLQCLRPDGTYLRRTSIDAFVQKCYLALSYTWEPSEYEDPESGRYSVEDWAGNYLIPSKVRDCVLDRVLSYMRYVKVQVLWIDAHCIRQDTCRVAACTRHPSCIEQSDAIQAMDLVYQLSEYPVALLGRPLRVESELQLLARILSGKFVDKSINRLSMAIAFDEAREALWLLREITRDAWWTRAWTFQENYRGGQEMQLLIAHDSSLEQQKLRLEMFGKISGELCIQSVSFSKQATRLCLALRRVENKLSPNEVCWIDGVLRAAGRYALVLPESSAMTPTVVADIEARGLTKPWDRLAILANCCQYSVRLDGEALRQQNHSLSLSILAMSLLNGEILNNDDDGLNLMTSITTSKFLQRYLFAEFSAPTDGTHRLTFNKGCRLTSAKLTAEGISTNGHLWKLGRVVDTSMFPRKLPRIDEPNGRLKLDQRKRLLQLVLYLFRQRYRDLAGHIDGYLADDARAGKSYVKFTDKYLHRMATELATAIEAGRKLRLGRIWDPTESCSPYSAVFVWSNGGGYEGEAYPAPAFVFTSAWFRDPGSDAHDANDIDRHVSLEVSISLNRDGVPRLRTHAWRLGMCFFKGSPRTKVVFPWPRALQAVQSC